MLLLTGCGDTPPVEPLTPDPDQLRACIDYQVAVPHLTSLEPFQLPDGRWVVLQDVVLDREGQTVEWIMAERSGRMLCRSTAVYVGDWIDKVQR